ncbi:MAG: integrating conjugative element protein [Pseudomonadota bacterium]
MREEKRYLRSLLLYAGFALAVTSVTVQADDEFYYLLGGGEPVTQAATNRAATSTIGGSIRWNNDLMCGNFDMSLSVQNQLQGLEGSFSDLMDNVISAATGAVASLPALIIQKVNPALYDLLQNGILQGSEEFHIAKAECEDIVERMGDVIDGNEWEAAARGGWWSGRSVAGGDILDAKDDADSDGLDEGVTWAGGAQRGGAAQPPVLVVEDTAKAGFNMLLNRNPTNSTSASTVCAEAYICRRWDNPQAFSDWMVAVVGEKTVRTCEGCDKVETQAGMGLPRQIEVEQEQIALDLEALVLTDAAPTADELEEVSGGPGMRITRRVVEALREEDPENQEILIARIASEMALSRIMEMAVVARRAILAGSKEPNIANLEVAQEDLGEYIAELEREMDNILYELEVRERIASNTAVAVLQRQQARVSIPISEPQPEARFEDGAVMEP